MAEIAHGGQAAPSLRPPAIEIGVIGWMHKNLFGNVFSSILTILAGAAIVTTVPGIIDWAIIRAVWVADNSAPCKVAGAGACWAFIADKHRLIFFGTYPYAEQWRPLAATVILLGLIIGSCDRRLWSRWLMAYWAVGLVAVGVLMWGGVFGLTYVSNLDWGGLPLTIIMAVAGCIFAFPSASCWRSGGGRRCRSCAGSASPISS